MSLWHPGRVYDSTVLLHLYEPQLNLSCTGVHHWCSWSHHNLYSQGSLGTGSPSFIQVPTICNSAYGSLCSDTPAHHSEAEDTKAPKDTKELLSFPEGEHGNLKNPMDRGTWWATVHRVIKSLTWLKRLSTTSLIKFPPKDTKAHLPRCLPHSQINHCSNAVLDEDLLPYSFHLPGHMGSLAMVLTFPSACPECSLPS